ncbi:hypothetical protein [Baekduia sp. Peel2402]|uniref:hypothetical protein n=1 Tax=Baekduia sp. Peel2402 TaxID=3458296 RepID=UPI00403EBC57
MPEYRYVPRYVDLLICAAVTLAALWLAYQSGLAAALYQRLDDLAPHSASVLVVLATPLAVWIHELGHWAAAKGLVGGEVQMSVRFFHGKVSYGEGGITPEQHLLVTLAGPLASAVAVVAGLAALPSFANGTLAHLVLYGTVVTSVIGVLNLIPFRFRLDSSEGSQVVTSDGRAAFDALFALWALRR